LFCKLDIKGKISAVGILNSAQFLSCYLRIFAEKNVRVSVPGVQHSAQFKFKSDPIIIFLEPRGSGLETRASRLAPLITNQVF
jgi:hypothetical protein